MSTPAAEFVFNAERAFVVLLLDSPHRLPEAVDLVRPSDIFDPTLRRVYEAMLAIDRRGEQLDRTAVAVELGGNPPHSWLVEHTEYGCTSAFLGSYCARVRACAVAREIGERMGEVSATARSEPMHGEEHLEAAEKAVFEIASRSKPNPVETPRDLAPHVFERLDNPDIRARGVQTGLYDLDKMLGGLEPGALIVVGARPSVGKSTLGLVMAHNLAREGKRVVFFSLEMSSQVVMDRLVSINSGVSLKLLRENALDSVERSHARAGVRDVEGLPIYIESSPFMSAMGMRGVVRRLAHREPIDAVFVDYLQLVTPSGGESRVEQVGTISRGLKMLAREFDVPVIAAAQLNRKTEDRAAPVLSDLRESGSIEADADVVLFIHRPNRSKEQRTSEECDLICAKNRNGPTCSVSVLFELSAVRFQNLTRVGEEIPIGRPL